ncbi:MAG: hydrogen peroxide-inducible genes activator [Alphaproteobacteria bacterium]|nr:hydrogen peroxide-inducible genes activator [Alphaproteobacteria bacterium]
MNPFHSFDFSLRQLQYAVAVAEAGHFGQAAEACAVSQPALSAQIARLEAALGVPLFERGARGSHPTAAGRALLPRMREALDQAADLREAARALVDPYAVTLRVGIIPTVAPYLLPALSALLQDRAPAPRVHWLEMKTEACERALADGQLDAMLIADPPALPGAVHEDLGWERFHMIVPPGHPLREPVAPQDVNDQELLLLEDGHCLRDHALALCLRPGVQESPYRATSLPTLVQMVAAGLGTSVLPAMAVPVEVGRARVRVLPFTSTGVGRALVLAWRGRSAHGALLRELAGLAREAVAVAAGEELTARQDAWGRGSDGA